MAKRLKVLLDVDLNDAEAVAELERIQRKLRGVEPAANAAGKGMRSFAGSADATLVALKGLIPVLGLGALASFAKSSLEAADSIGKIADKVGVSTSALQEYRHAAELSGVAQNQLDTALQRFSRRVGEAAQGQGDLLKTLEQYNIAVRNADGSTRSLDAILGDYADALAGAGSQQEKLRMAFKAFDSEGAALVNMLRGGRDGLDDMREAARDAGLVIEDSTIRAAEALNDEWSTAVKQADTLFKQFLLDSMAGWREMLGMLNAGALERKMGAITEGALSPAAQGIVDTLAQLHTQARNLRSEIAGFSDRGIVAGVIGSSLPALESELARVTGKINQQESALKRELASLAESRKASRSLADEQRSLAESISGANGVTIGDKWFRSDKVLAGWQKVKPELQRGISSFLRDAEKDTGLRIQISSTYRTNSKNHVSGSAVDLGMREFTDQELKKLEQYWQANSYKYNFAFPVAMERPGDPLSKDQPHWHAQLIKNSDGAKRATAGLIHAQREAQKVAKDYASAQQAAASALRDGAADVEDYLQGIRDQITLSGLSAVGQAELRTELELTERARQAELRSVEAAARGNTALSNALMTVSSGYREAIPEAKRLTAELAAGQAAADELAAVADVGRDFGMVMESALGQAIRDGGQLSDVLRGLAQDMIQLIAKAALLKPLEAGLSAAFDGNAATTFAGAFGKAFSGAFGGGKAVGGPVHSGTTYLVGEQGPELFSPHTSGTIIPNNAIGAPRVNVTVNTAPGYDAQVTQGADGSLTIDQVRAVLAGDLATGGQQWTRHLDGRMARGY